ncbi:Oxoglutarate/iron-dependent dioxygenase [Penicillium cf. griseofulvum]|uniref:Oxoglutarate/iron-dependent dioxygenase n=1 Tax=Penicillium cf. griseofulvum TaxID=2972120 RepID=A0A9W9T787_9EURO|nr:Oxoglutarate/iron-dependent dioxygenase [Penicillium cf. griseofulvum]
MNAFISRKRLRLSTLSDEPNESSDPHEDTTDTKLAILLSLFPAIKQDELLDILVSCEGSVKNVTELLSAKDSTSGTPVGKKRAAVASAFGMQTSLSSHVLTTTEDGSMKPMHENARNKKLPPPKKGKTLHLYSPEDIAAYTPCTIIHNFLPANEADTLLLELLDESKHFSRYDFQLFSRTVQSPHTNAVYVSTPEEHRQQTSEYTYGGRYLSNVRQVTPQLRSVSRQVQKSVNNEINKRIRDVYPDGKKLKYQSPKEWRPNAAFVNCYDGPSESVGYHSDKLTYLGPHPVIGSLSLGVTREFRVRRIVPRDDDETTEEDHNANKTSPVSNSARNQTASAAHADAQGQISIHLPHNSLLIMHAEMQEEWKHSIAPARTISPHPISGNRRINITYRWYRDTLHPRYTPRCMCDEPTILRCVQRKHETRGRYMWMCYAGYAPGKEGCSFFQWAEFDDDGDPVWGKEVIQDKAPTLANFSASQ